MEIVFGPVPSRRLGRSLGINTIPPKACSYGCAYCQVGRTLHPEVELRMFAAPDDVAASVGERVGELRSAGERIDYLTFVPDGEPTLDARLAASIEAIRPLGIPVAVISNGSLLWRPEVREALRRADWVSVKVDAVDEPLWRKVNAPHASLRLDTVLQGIRDFAAGFEGTLVSETMLLGGINDSPPSVAAVAGFLGSLPPAVAYLAVPTRPPAKEWARPPDERALIAAYREMEARLPTVELLVGEEGDAFSSTGDLRRDLLAITAVHPMRRAAAAGLAERTGAGWAAVEELIEAGDLAEVSYGGDRFLVRAFRR
jgi:wyosine [tRNA(Phe)-imidazoG37] synthetase (radical SAM superfamily)